MNNAKLTKLKKYFRSPLLHSACIAVISPFILKAIENYRGINLMKSLYQSFVVELWPIWVGLAFALLYWASREIISIHKFLTAGLKFDEKLNEFGIERRKLMTHVNESYNGLSNKIDRSLSAFSDRIDKIEKIDE